MATIIIFRFKFALIRFWLCFSVFCYAVHVYQRIKHFNFYDEMLNVLYLGKYMAAEISKRDMPFI